MNCLLLSIFFWIAPSNVFFLKQTTCLLLGNDLFIILSSYYKIMCITIS